MSAISSLSIIVLSLIGGGWQIKKAKGPPRRAALYTWMISRSIRSCLDFISALVGKTFCIDFFSRSAANSGLFARIERKKMPKRISNKPNSLLVPEVAPATAAAVAEHFIATIFVLKNTDVRGIASRHHMTL